MAHAVVIGASVAGLTMAKALTTRYRQVTVLDRDLVPEGMQQRSGIPQGHHLHVLLPAGGRALEALFPGIVEEMARDGSPLGDMGLGRVCLNGHRFARGALGLESVFASRPFVEGHVRRRVRAEPGVTILDGHAARSLATSLDRRVVTGVEVGPPVRGGATSIIEADLVVDCSGRRSSAPKWLTDLGYAAPEVEELRVDVFYSTRHYQVPAGVLDGELFILVGPTRDRPRVGAMGRIEGDRWLVTLGGMGGERPSLDPDRFEGYAAGLARPDLHEILTRSQPLDDPAGSRFASSRRHHYEGLDRFPEGLLVAGDAIASFNPIYGQGMSVAALEAVAMRELLERDAPPDASTWFTRAAAVVDVPWNLAVGADLAVRCIQGRRTLRTRMLGWYLARLHAAAAVNPSLGVTFLRVAGLLDPPARLLRPATVATVLRHRMDRGAGAAGEQDVMPPKYSETPD